MIPVRKKQWLRLFVYLGLLLLAAGYIALCVAGLGLPCFFYETFHLRCPGCGASRAFFALLRLDFAGAARQNAVFAFAFYPIGGLIAAQDLALCIVNLLCHSDRVSFLRYLFSAHPKTTDKEDRAI